VRQVGDPVLLRSVYKGRVRFAFTHRLAVVDGERLGFYGCPGTPGVWMGRDLDGRYLERWARGDDPVPHVWADHHALRLVRPGVAHTVEIFWDESWEFRFWYANLQAPVRETPLGYDTTDWALDVWAAADGEPCWKDEDDFAEAVELGIFTKKQAAAVRSEGERVVADPPWPTGYEDWRPPPEWTPPELPEDWDVV
jgi:hypothetical protein